MISSYRLSSWALALVKTTLIAPAPERKGDSKYF
jgi:hypothetical protein